MWRLSSSDPEMAGLHTFLPTQTKIGHREIICRFSKFRKSEPTYTSCTELHTVREHRQVKQNSRWFYVKILLFEGLTYALCDFFDYITTANMKYRKSLKLYLFSIGIFFPMIFTILSFYNFPSHKFVILKILPSPSYLLLRKL